MMNYQKKEQVECGRHRILSDIIATLEFTVYTVGARNVTHNAPDIWFRASSKAVRWTAYVNQFRWPPENFDIL